MAGSAGRPRNRTHRLLIAAALVAGAACTSREPAPTGLGVRRAAAAARDLAATADGAWVAWLDGCADARARSLPLGTATCDLRVVPATGGDPVLVAQATTSLPGAVLASPTGAEVAAVAGYDYAVGAGTLVVWRAGAGPRALAEGVTFHGYGPDGTLGYIAGGELYLATPGGAPAKVAGVSGATSFELAGPGEGLAALVRRRGVSGGELLAVPPRSDSGAVPAAVPVAGKVGDYGFGRGRLYAFTRMEADGARLELSEARPAARPTPLAKAVRVFAFAPQGEAIAYVAEASPGKQGNLHVRAAGGAERALAREVGEFRWAARAPRLAWLEEYDPRVRSGTIGAGGLDAPRRTFGKNVSDLELSADGRFVAFLQHSTRGGYSVDLLLADVTAPEGTAPRRIAQGSFGFSFSPDGKWLYYRTRCERNGEACDLERTEVAAPAAKPELVAEGVKSFEYAPHAPGRLLLTWKRMDRDALDVGVWEPGRLVRVDTHVRPGSARFLGRDARRLAYVVVQEKRAGVYVAELGGPGAR